MYKLFYKQEHMFQLEVDLILLKQFFYQKNLLNNQVFLPKEELLLQTFDQHLRNHLR